MHTLHRSLHLDTKCLHLLFILCFSFETFYFIFSRCFVGRNPICHLAFSFFLSAQFVLPFGRVCVCVCMCSGKSSSNWTIPYNPHMTYTNCTFYPCLFYALFSAVCCYFSFDRHQNDRPYQTYTNRICFFDIVPHAVNLKRRKKEHGISG